MILAVTGHRPDKLGLKDWNPVGDRPPERALLRTAQAMLVTKTPRLVVSGMAQGWDQTVVEACLALSFPFLAAVPTERQAALWPRSARVRYFDYLKRAKAVVLVDTTPGYRSADVVESMGNRNRWMVDHSDQLVALWNGTPGGTSSCVDYASTIGRPWTNVWKHYGLYLNEERMKTIQPRQGQHWRLGTAVVKITAVEARHALIEYTDKENRWGGPEREWVAVERFGNADATCLPEAP